MLSHADRHDPRLFGAWAFKTPFIKLIPGNYSPFYFLEQTGCFIFYYFQCKAEDFVKKRKNQQLCTNLTPYTLLIGACSQNLVENQSYFFEALPYLADDADMNEEIVCE